MSYSAYLAIAGAVGALSAMALGISADRALVAALALLVLTGAVTPDRALDGLANEGVATVALLFVLAGGVKRSGALTSILGFILGRHRGIRRTSTRLMLPVAGVSAFLNNTPVVAMLLPELKQWAADHGVAPSRLLIPLSYAAIVGGMCTLIGTSTNLLIDGLLVERGFEHLSIFWIASLGLPAAAAAILAMIVLGPVLLPRRRLQSVEVADPRQFSAEFVVEQGPLAGKALSQVVAPGLRAFAPIEIRRDGDLIIAPSPHERLKAGDRVLFAAPSAEILAVSRIEGLVAADNVRRKRAITSDEGNLVEAMVGPRCPLIGHTAGDGSFRREYGAAVLAVVRDGRQKPTDELGAWILEVGDVLLLEADTQFSERHRYGGELILITDHGQPTAHASWHPIFSLAVIVAMAGVVAFGLTSMLIAGLGAAVLFITARVLTWQEAAKDIEVRVLLAIVAALGIGAALEDSGAALAAAGLIVQAGGESPLLALALVYLATALCTELVTNNAAAVLMLPIALGTAAGLDVSPLPFIGSVMVAASASFVTPIGYQTNLMVYGAGGYRFSDFTRIGLPIAIIVAGITIGLAPIVYPF